MFYLNNNRPLVINSEIIEWDIKSANLSLIKEYSLLPEDMIQRIPTDNKDKREKHVGLLMRDNKEFSKALEKKFDEVILYIIYVILIQSFLKLGINQYYQYWFIFFVFIFINI